MAYHRLLVIPKRVMRVLLGVQLRQGRLSIFQYELLETCCLVRSSEVMLQALAFSSPRPQLLPKATLLLLLLVEH